MIHKSIILLLAIASSILAAGSGRPNVILILADDLGFSDVGCYGGEIATPNIDRLASNGLRFSQFYNSGKCEPTRASLMSGPTVVAKSVGSPTTWAAIFSVSTPTISS